ncbi:MAG: chromate resistance protein ChrB [Actinobacteria bacterium]|nr:chromate resistance protein ChrB [Actinomycetota bacterium]
MKWLMLCYSVPSDTSRHRVAVWRELRRIGAISPQQAVWALPDHAGSRHALENVAELVEAAGGEALLVRAQALNGISEKRLEELYVVARDEEYIEFLAECDKFEAEIDSEIRKRKFTAAELDEEEQNFDRLVRWHRDLTRKMVFPVASSAVADKRLKECEQSLADFADLIFEVEQL